MKNDAKQRQFAVVMPKPDADRPAWGRVGVIAAVGFVIGIAWPRVAGVKLGPNAPNDPDKAQAASSAPPASLSVSGKLDPIALNSQIAPNANASASAAPSASVAPVPAGPPDVTVSRGVVINCRNEDGEALKGKDCGNGNGFDGIAMGRLHHLAQCSAAVGVTGKLSTVFSLDFTAGRVGIDIGKSSTVQNQDSLATCLKTEFYGVMLNGVPHDQPKYTVAYHVNFTAPTAASIASAAAADNPPPQQITDSAPTAQVAWEVALVRDTPKSGSIVARLPRGSKVRVGAPKDGWYRIQFGNGFSTEGWVYRGAIGK